MSLITCLNCSKQTSKFIDECIHCDESIELSLIDHDKKQEEKKRLLLDAKSESQNLYYKKAIDWKVNKKFTPIFTIIFFASWIYLFWLFDNLYPSDGYAYAFWSAIPLFILIALIIAQLELWFKSFFFKKYLKK